MRYCLGTFSNTYIDCRGYIDILYVCKHSTHKLCTGCETATTVFNFNVRKDKTRRIYSKKQLF